MKKAILFCICLLILLGSVFAASYAVTVSCQCGWSQTFKYDAKDQRSAERRAESSAKKIHFGSSNASDSKTDYDGKNNVVAKHYLAYSCSLSSSDGCD